MKLHKCLPALLAALLALTLCVSALAHEVPDTSRTGSISFKMECAGHPVPGGTLTLRRVGEIASDDGNYFFVLTEEFAESGLSLEDVSSPELASALADYARLNGITGEDVAIGSDGTAKVEGLVLGLYLVTQKTAAFGYSSVAPFLVSVPMYDDVNGVYVYDVDAEPKMEEVTELPVVIISPSPVVPSEPVPSGEPVNPSEPPVEPTEPVTPVTPVEPILPQTGQLNWPIPALTVLGLCLMLLGFYLRAGKEKSV